ncbi:cation:proton antiporter [Acetobacter sp.]|uniref:cation:proton antiporter n=1 Tax=Acetobacter sp. TaxID=440 RepID=UPI0039EA659B
MDTITLVAVLLTLSASFSILNAWLFRLPMTIGVLVISLIVCLVILVLNPFIPGYDLLQLPQKMLGAVNLPEALLNGALCVLLFAGALGVDLRQFWSKLPSIATLSVLGTVLAVILLAGAVWLVFPFLGARIPFSWCVLLGSILAPTDPVSVVGMLKRAGLPAPLRAIFAGESLLNDGVSIVIFGVAFGLATGQVESVTTLDMVIRFVREAAGGVALGIALGWLALGVLRGIRDPHINLLVSLALATGTYSLAMHLHVSGPVAVVIAGLCLGTKYGQSIFDDESRKELDLAWSLLDEVLNVILFLLIGFEILDVPPHIFSFSAMLVVIPLTIAIRALSVFLAMAPLYRRHEERRKMLAILTWGGLRGGISIALALALPPSDLRNLLLPICYGVVVFTIIVQGLTMEKVVRRLYPGK